MFRRGLTFFWTLALVALLAACSSAPRKDAGGQATLTAADSAAVAKAVAQKSETKQPATVQNLDVAHESFIRAMEMELRGEKALAEIFWQRAFEADPESRYLSFAVAERIAAHGVMRPRVKIFTIQLLSTIQA